jgi:RNA polymerase sigma factor (sigma-70 family)
MTHLAAIARLVTREERRDGDLLAAFLLRRDEAAFAELIRRHGPMAWGVCRRSLPDAADAEDAFQAAFLVLVRKAHQLTRQATVGPWLYRVAAWTARNLRRKNARRLARTMPLADVAKVPPREPGFDLDAALLALPEKYRTPLVLCHLIGLSRREAALQLGCPEGTLSARLSRALAKLRVKMRGQDPLPMLAATAGGIVPASLATATERTAIAFALASLIPTTAGPAAMLAEGVLRMFWIKKVVATAVAAMVMMAVGGSMIGIVAMQGSGKATAHPQEQKDQVQKDILEFQKQIAQLKANLEILRSQGNHIQAEIKNTEIDLAHRAKILDKLTKIARANAPNLIAGEPKKQSMKDIDRLLFVMAYERLNKIELQESLAGNLKKEIIYIEMLRLKVAAMEAMKKMFAGDNSIPIEIMVSNYRLPELELEDEQIQLKRLLKTLGNEHPQVKEQTSKVNSLELKVKHADPNRAPFAISEYDNVDQISLSSTCWGLKELTKHLARIRRDEKASKDVVILVTQGTPAERLV